MGCLATAALTATIVAFATITEPTDRIDVFATHAGGTTVVAPTTTCFEGCALPGRDATIERNATIGMTGTGVANGRDLTDVTATHSLMGAFGVGRALNVIGHTNAAAAGLTVSTILVHGAGSILTDTLPRGTQAPQRALPVVFAFRCTGRLRKHDKKKHETGDDPNFHAWVFPCLMARPKYARAPWLWRGF